MRKIVLANAAEFDVEYAGESSTVDGNKKTFSMTFSEYTLEELRISFMNPANIKVVKLFDSDGELIRIVKDYDFYDIQLKYVNHKEQIIVNLSIGDTLKQEVAKLQSTVIQLQENVPVEEDMDMMTSAELKTYKKSLLQSECRKTIYQGVDIKTFSYGIQHFSYTDDDQRNLESLFNTALITDLDIPYHADGEICKTYPSEDIIRIYTSLQNHKLYHTTYINALNRYIDNLSDLKVIKSVSYGKTTLPKEYLDNMNAVLTQGQTIIQKIIESAKGDKNDKDFTADQ